ncbi:MAG: C10 family peptidase [Bacteroidales bacterium]|nr:C10 family peptidase [Bacteroidales bacterium]
MKQKIIYTIICFVLAQCCIWQPFSNKAMGATVNETEALAIADLWYAMELNSGYLSIDPAEKEECLRNIPLHTIQYFIAEDQLLDYIPPDLPVLAYVITYYPNGYVIIPGDDRILPVIAFDVVSEFRWDHPELNFMRHYLNTRIPAYWENLGIDTHPGWEQLRSKIHESLEKVKFDEPTDDRSVYLLWETALWGQGTYYNETVIANNGGTAGIPTGCTATAMAIKMRFHSWPVTGNSSHSYNDVWGAVQYSHSVNFGTKTYYWSLMPTSTLTSTNTYVGDLMYHCGVAVDMNYEVGISCAWPSASSMNTYFRYKGSYNIWAPSAYASDMQTSILGGLPVVTSSSAHTVLADGYRDTQSPYFHLNCGWNSAGNGWYDLSTGFPGGDPSIDYSMPFCQPQHYFYVNGSYSGTENGNLKTPYNTIDEGYSATPTNGELWIKGGTYSGTTNTGTFDKAMMIKNYQGTVTIQ